MQQVFQTGANGKISKAWPDKALVSKSTNMQINWKMQRGISLIEILITVTIFAILGIIVTRSVILTLQGSKKSEGIVAVRENLDYSMSVIQRQLTNASSVPSCSSPAPTPSSRIDYVDQNGIATYFLWTSASSAIASGSATTLLTNPGVVKVTSTSFTCWPSTITGQPSHVDVTLTAQSATLTGAQNSSVSQNAKIYLRNY